MRKSCVYLYMIISSLILTGCWDRYELEERANILGLAIDLADEDEIEKEPEVTHRLNHFPGGKTGQFYKITAQVAVPGKIKLGPEGGGGEGSEKTAWIIKTFGHTMNDAMANLQQQLAEKLYLGHLQIIVVSREVSEKGVSEINDFLRRDPEVRRTAWMIIDDKDASKVLKAAPPIETVPSLYLSDTLDNAVRFGKLPREYMGKFWIDLSDDGVDATLPAVKVMGNDRLLIDGMAFFKGDKMVGKTTPGEIGAYMGMKEKSPGGYSIIVSIEDEEGVYLIKSLKRKSKTAVEIRDGKPMAFINIKVEAAIEEKTNDSKLDSDTLKKVELAANKKAEEICSELVKKLQEKGSDIFGLGARVKAKYAGYWEREVNRDEQWSNVFKEMEIKVKADFNIRRAGMEIN